MAPALLRHPTPCSVPPRHAALRPAPPCSAPSPPLTSASDAEGAAVAFADGSGRIAHWWPERTVSCWLPRPTASASMGGPTKPRSATGPAAGRSSSTSCSRVWSSPTCVAQASSAARPPDAVKDQGRGERAGWDGGVGWVCRVGVSARPSAWSATNWLYQEQWRGRRHAQRRRLHRLPATAPVQRARAGGPSPTRTPSPTPCPCLTAHDKWAAGGRGRLGRVPFSPGAAQFLRTVALWSGRPRCGQTRRRAQ